MKIVCHLSIYAALRSRNTFLNEVFHVSGSSIIRYFDLLGPILNIQLATVPIEINVKC